MRRITLSSILITAVLLLGTRPGYGVAGPAIVMFYGPTLAKPVHFVVDIPYLGMVDQPTTPGEIPESELAGRSYVNFAAFWHHPTWAPYLADPDLLVTLRPEQGSQHGRIYPPTPSEPAVLLSTRPRLSTTGSLAARMPIPLDSRAFEWRGSLTVERWKMLEPIIRPRR